MENNSAWSLTTKGLYNAVLIQTICGAANALISAIIMIQLMSADSLIDLAAIADSASVGGVWGILGLIAGIGSLVGFILFFMNIAKFKTLVNANDAPAVGNIHTAMILTIVTAVLSILAAFIPFLSIITLIIAIIALVFQLMGFNALKNSTTFPDIAREGANKIFTAIIISLVAGFVSGLFSVLVPILGLIAYLAVIYAWIMQLQGWALIAKSEQPR